MKLQVVSTYAIKILNHFTWTRIGQVIRLQNDIIISKATHTHTHTHTYIYIYIYI